MARTRTSPLADRAQAARGIAWLAKQVELALAEVDLTLPQYRVLGLLDAGGASATAAADRLAVSPPSVTAVIDGLVGRSLVVRSHVEEDRRKVQLLLTDQGHAALERADEAVAARLGDVAAHGQQDRTLDEALDGLTWWLEALRAKRDAAIEAER